MTTTRRSFVRAAAAVAMALAAAAIAVGVGVGLTPARPAAAGAPEGAAARCHTFVAARWTIAAGVARALDQARARLDAPAAPPAARANPYLHAVDDAIADPAWRRAIRAVQPATVRLGVGSGVNLAATGVVLTAGHVARRVGARLTVRFPDGATYRGRATAYDPDLDLAVVALDGAHDLPWAPVAAAPPEVGDPVCVIGQPGARTPDGEPTGYQPWTVSTGRIRGFRAGSRLGEQRLGRTEHDAWTYGGHSGSPLFDGAGAIVALHNSWDSTTGMRHAVTWEAIVHFLDGAGVAYHVRR